MGFFDSLGKDFAKQAALYGASKGLEFLNKATEKLPDIDVDAIDEALEEKAEQLQKRFEKVKGNIAAAKERYESQKEIDQDRRTNDLRGEFPLEMILNKKNPKWLDGALVSTSSGSVNYRIIAELEWGRRSLKVLDEKNEAIIVIEENQSAYTITGKHRSTYFIIKVFGNTFDNVSSRLVKFHREFEIPDTKWRTTEDHNQYKVLDQTGYTMAVTDRFIAKQEVIHMFFKSPETAFLSLALLLLHTIGHRDSFNEDYINYCLRMADRDARFNTGG